MQLKNHITLTLTSGNIGKETLAANQNNLKSYPYEPYMEEDCFIHLLTAGSLSLTSTCSFTLTTINSWHFLCPYEGTFEVSSNGKNFTCQPGHLLFLSPCESLDFRIKSSHCRFFYAGFHGRALTAYRNALPEDIAYAHAHTGASRLSDCIGHLLYHVPYHTEADMMMCSKWINDIFTELCVYETDSTRLREQIPSYIREMKDLFDNEYQEQYSLEYLEQHFDKSRYRLCREFTQYFSMSPIQYLNHRRMEAAKELLLSTSMSIHEIGSSVGIDNTNHFINLFKKETGTTPLVFKQEAPVSVSELHYPYTPDARQQ